MASRGARHEARAMAVQALYWWAFDDWEGDWRRRLRGVAEWEEARGGGVGGSGGGVAADMEFAEETVRGAGEEREVLDEILARCLSGGAWRPERLDAMVRAVLRAGVWELRNRREVPARATIDAYVEVVKSFSSQGGGAGLVNAVLDSAAREERGEELSDG